MDEMEIINLLKSCNKKVRKTPRPKNAPKLPKSDDPRDDEQNPKKAPKSPEFIESDDSGKEEEEPKKAPRTQDDKEKKNLRRVNGAQSFFDLRKETKNLTIEKKVERVIFITKPYIKAANYHMLHYMIPTTPRGYQKWKA